MATNLNVTELDFDQIKDNLKNFLRRQTEFNDYDFDGSGLSVLLDVLAYNTHYNAINAHYSLNEAFLDSAQIRGNVVTRAKLLGYIPRSILSPVATVNIVVTSDNPSAPKVSEGGTNPDQLTLPKGTKLKSSLVNGIQFDFVVKNSQIADFNTGVYTFNNVEIVEGELRTLVYRVDNNIEVQKFQLSDKNADTSTLRVRAQENQKSTAYDIYTQFQTLKNVDSTTKVFYLQENNSGFYEVYFGDGVTGFKPINNNLINLDYVITKGKEANGSAGFTINDTVGGFSNIAVTTVSAASGGDDQETIESIRFNAPLQFATQSRAVTSDDYAAIIKQNFSNIQSISTWGGEDNDPPDYGRSYIAVKPITASTLTATEKTQITDILKGKNVVSITPEIVDPTFTNLELDVFVRYNPNLTDRASSDITSVVKDTISDYNFNNLNKFDGVFRHSELLRNIDKSDPSILSSTVRPRMFQTIAGTTSSTTNNFELNFVEPFHDTGASTKFILTSSAFRLASDSSTDHFFGDVPITGSSNRRIIIYKVVGNDNVTVNDNAGELDLANGKITLHSFALNVATNITLTVVPTSLDLAPSRNQILNIDSSKVSVTTQIDTIAVSGSAGAINYTTTPRIK